jgi:hypothetical protein
MNHRITLLALAGALALTACDQGSTDTSSASSPANRGVAQQAPPSPELAKVVLTSGAPQQTVAVAAAKKDTKDGDAVAVVGRVKDFVDGQAVFTVMDPKIQACSDHPGDKCPTPWDYCCETKDTISQNSATVKIVGDAGADALKGNLQGVNSLDHLTTVVAEGKAQRDAAGNLTVLANKVYVTQ